MYPHSRPHEPLSIDLLGATAQDIQELLTAGTVSSVQLVDKYIDQINTHDGYLRAVLEISPSARKHAESLDNERRNGVIRGPLHGVPILLKDNIATPPCLDMNTSAGSFALVGSRPTSSADVVIRLMNAGMVILGKTNLSVSGAALSKVLLLTRRAGIERIQASFDTTTERSRLMVFRASRTMPGWSAVGGQTQSAYTRGNVDLSDTGLGHSSPGGSSTGSAVAVSAGYSPVSIGTDTGGSLITPATRAALYTIRPTMGLVSQQGVVPISKLFDTVGPMAKSAADLAHLLDVLVEPRLIAGAGSYSDSLPGDFSEIRVGVLRPEDWLFGPDLQRTAEFVRQQMVRDTYAAYKKIRGVAKSFQEVTLISPDRLMIDGISSFYEIQTARFKTTLEEYLQTLGLSKIRTLDDLIRFNKDYKDLELSHGYASQDQLVAAAEANMSTGQHDRLLRHVRTVSRDLGIDKTLKEYDIDVIIAPADSAFSLLVSAAGYPSATMPLSLLDYNGRPIGLAAFTTANGEKILLKALSAWEAISSPRKPPPSLVVSNQESETTYLALSSLSSCSERY
ncbi:related to glu/asp-tRNA amidotransferase subunit A [Phialocephala subalpina]|uniref:Related to glu/asp-tRNA amidotransferase subunit A n=1 Tax=Phialocephala subalpina TaxID=576137 RepID=A0A1L7WRQ8_9HELO|nr:related to glu/asp-tRNA amidotransferase subunit A [Phialocephala subalpina]